MLIHSARFWLRKDPTPAERDLFPAEVRRFAQISCLRAGFVGSPAQKDRRSVADHSFDFASSLHFKSLQDREFHQATCEHHASFASACQSFCAHVVIHDIAPFA